MFIDTLKKIIALVPSRERRAAYLLLVMILIMALLDMVGIASIMPLLSVLASPNVLEKNHFLASIYDSIGFNNTGEFLYFLGAVVFVFLVVSIAFKAITVYCILRFTHLRSYLLSKRLVMGYLHQPYEWFLSRHSASLGKTVLSEVEQVTQGAMIPMMQLIAQGAVAVALIFLLFVVNPGLAFASAAALCSAYALIYVLLRRYLMRIGIDRVHANEQRFKIVQESFVGIKDVKIRGLEPEILKQFEAPARRYAQYQAVSQAVSYVPRYLLEAIAFGGILIVVLYLMRDPAGLQGALPLIGLYAFAGYRLLPALQQVYAQLVNLRYAKPALDALYTDVQMIGMGGGQKQQPLSATPMGLRSNIKLVRVKYRYPKAERPAIDDLDLQIAANTTVGIVGGSGCGKSTTVDLILGLLSPQKGELLVDGTAIGSENVRAWQKCVGYVPQHIHLVDATIAENIAFGIPFEMIDWKAIEDAARIANLHDFIEDDLPAGYQTSVGESGIRLSGGQRQRLGIARSLYSKPELLIFDEATSALDNLTEQAVMDAVHNLSHKKTIIIIAHRLSTVRACDLIHIMDRGRVEASGSYEYLQNNSVRFRSMVEACD